MEKLILIKKTLNSSLIHAIKIVSKLAKKIDLSMNLIS